jgi:hypothetical protein
MAAGVGWASAGPASSPSPTRHKTDFITPQKNARRPDAGPPQQNKPVMLNKVKHCYRFIQRGGSDTSLCSARRFLVISRI